MSVKLARLAHGRRINQRHDLLDILLKHPVKKRLIPILQREQEDVPLERIRLLSQIFKHPPHLVLRRLHGRRQQPAQSQRIAFGFCKSGSLVEGRIVEYADSARQRIQGRLHGWIEGVVRQLVPFSLILQTSAPARPSSFAILWAAIGVSDPHFILVSNRRPVRLPFMIRFPSVRKCALISLGLSLLALCGCEQTPTPPAASPTPSPTPSSASVTPNSFSEVTAQLDPGGDLYFYLSTAQWTSKISKGIDALQTAATANQPPDASQQTAQYIALLKDILQKSGIEAISGIGASSINYAPDLYRNKIFIHHYPADGSGVIWSLYGKEPHPLTGLDFLPADTVLAGIGDFDLAQFIGFLRDEASQSGIPQLQQSVTQLQTQLTGLTGLKLDDVLGALGSTVGVVADFDNHQTLTIPIGNQPQVIPLPRIALLIAVKSDLIFKQIDRLLSVAPGMVKVDEPDLKMRTVALPFAPAVTVRPTFAQWNGFLVIASDDNLVRDMMAVQKGAPGFKSTPEYATLSAGLPQQGNRFAVSTQRFADFMQKIESQTYFRDLRGTSQSALLQHFQKPGRFMSVGSVLPNGWLSVNQGSQESIRMLAPALIGPAMAVASSPGFLQALQGIHVRYAAPATPPPTSSPSATPPSAPATPGTSP